MTTILNALQAVRARISKAIAQSGRAPDSVRLLAVSKQVTASQLHEAYTLGLTAFGESYVQEAVKKIENLSALPIEWHFLGPLQSNKTKLIATYFAWVHSVDRVKLAQRLSDQRDPLASPLNICLQVNISGEASKSGVQPEAALALANQIQDLPGIQLRGLMAIPEHTSDISTQRAQFRSLRLLQEELVRHGHPLDTLSMGMSADLELAIEEGATLVRVGSALFGARGA